MGCRGQDCIFAVNDRDRRLGAGVDIWELGTIYRK